MPCHPDRVRRNAMAESTAQTACACGVADASGEIVAALKQFEKQGRIPRVINVGRSVYEHLADQRGSLAWEFSFRGVHVNYSADFPLDLIEVK